jgi:hypothetical protein
MADARDRVGGVHDDCAPDAARAASDEMPIDLEQMSQQLKSMPASGPRGIARIALVDSESAIIPRARDLRRDIATGVLFVTRDECVRVRGFVALLGFVGDECQRGLRVLLRFAVGGDVVRGRGLRVVSGADMEMHLEADDGERLASATVAETSDRRLLAFYPGRENSVVVGDTLTVAFVNPYYLMFPDGSFNVLLRDNRRNVARLFM